VSHVVLSLSILSHCNTFKTTSSALPNTNYTGKEALVEGEPCWAWKDKMASQKQGHLNNCKKQQSKKTSSSHGVQFIEILKMQSLLKTMEPCCA